MPAIVLRIVLRKDRLQDQRKMARQGKMPRRTDGWNADYPDAENFMELLYGPNVGQQNDARFSLPAYDTRSAGQSGATWTSMPRSVRDDGVEACRSIGSPPLRGRSTLEF